jgi:hypothetical protein
MFSATAAPLRHSCSPRITEAVTIATPMMPWSRSPSDRSRQACAVACAATKGGPAAPAAHRGEQRRAVLRYRREKPPSKWASLPNNQDAADLTEAEQRRVRERFPNTPLSKLPLLPRGKFKPTERLAMCCRR